MAGQTALHLLVVLLGLVLVPSTAFSFLTMSAVSKTIVITGANSGVGFAGAKKLSQLGHEVYVVCRNQERSNRAAKETGKEGTHSTG